MKNYLKMLLHLPQVIIWSIFQSEKCDNDKDERQRHLPEELILEHILPWLPVKRVIQCKLVSKNWYSAISSPTFILNTTKQPIKFHPSYPIECLFIQSGKSFYLYSCENDDNLTKSNLVKLDVEFDIDENDDIELVGSCNGLVCLAQTYGKYFFLFNPATNKSQKFYPEDYGSLNLPDYHIKPDVTWGFGYVPSLNDYKIVRIIMRWYGEMWTVHIFSLRSNRWKKLDCGIEVEGNLVCRSKLVNDTLYWIMVCDWDVPIYKIVGFDLELEKFHIFHHLAFNSTTTDVLCVMGGCLSLCTSNTRNDVKLEIVESPGTGKVVSDVFTCDLRLGQHHQLIGFTKTGKVFVVHNHDATLGFVDRYSKRKLVRFGYGRKPTIIESYVPSQILPLPLTELPNA